MKTVWRFLTKFANLIVCTLHCFDRVLFKGHLSLAAPRELEYFVDCVLKVRRSYFMKTMAPQFSDRLVEHARGWARKAGRIYQYRTGQFRKDEWRKTSSTIRASPKGSSVFSPLKKRVLPLHSYPVPIALGSPAGFGNNESFITTSSIDGSD